MDAPVVSLTGGQLKVSLPIYNALMTALPHLLRNALAHGIEAPSERLAAGKSAAGHLSIGAREDETGLTVWVQDDGRGLDREKLTASAAPMIIGILLVLRLPNDKAESSKVLTPEETGDSEKFLTPSLIMFLAYTAMLSMGSSMVGTFLVLYLQDIRGMTLALAAFISSSNMLSGLIAAPIGGYMASKYGDKKWLMIALFGGFALLGIAFQVSNNTLFMALYIAYGFCVTLGMAGRSAIMARLTPRKQRGLGYALFFLPGSIIGAVAPIVAGYLADLLGFQSIFNIAIVVNFLALGVLKFAVKVD